MSVSLRVRIAPSGKDILLNMSKSDDILSLKRMLAARLSTTTGTTSLSSEERDVLDAPPSRQRVFITGKELKNSQKIEDLPTNFVLNINASSKKRKTAPPVQVFLLPKVQAPLKKKK